MSTQTQQFSTLTENPDRRFYPRTAPQAPVFLDFSGNKPDDAILLNVSENGLLISTPNRLTSNFVTRLSLPLKGLSNPVQVTIRVVWASEAQHLAGIQLLNLTEHDRQQIRKWAACQSAPMSPPETDDPLLASSSAATSSDPDQGSETFAEDSSSETSSTIEPLGAPEIVGNRSTSTTVSRAFGIALLAAACLAAAVLLIKAAPRIPFAKFREYRHATTSAQTLAKNVETISVPPANPATAKPNAPAPTPSPAQSTSPSKPKAPASAMPSKPEPQQIEQAPAADDEADSAADAPEDKRGDSPSETSSSTPSESASVAPEPSAPAKPLPTADAKNPTALSPAVPPTTSSIPPSGLTVAPASARLTLSPRPAAPVFQPVIQMDAPPGRTLQVHLPSGYQAPFFSLPGERVLESPAATMRIRRSVHLPATHSGWPFNRSKKVVVGELISRVDPPAAQISTGSDASVRVKATISKDGHLASINQILGPANLVSAVTKALHEWRYQPTLVDGNAVETQCYVVFQFHAPSYRAAKR